jgi:putative ABC transport system substrate-binding protein
VNRRAFITLLGGAAAAWPLAARAQQTARARRIGMVTVFAADDPEAQARVTAFAQGLQELGWITGRNVRIDYRWAATDAERAQKSTAELIALNPDVIVAVASTIARISQQLTRTVPIVFVNAVDPVGAGLVASLARPGGNITGFTAFEYGISAKRLELLKEIAPRLTRAAVIRDAAVAAGIGQFAAIQAMAPSLGVEITPIGVDNPSEIERGVTAFAREPNGGLIVASGQTAFHRDLIIRLAAQHRLPAVYPFGYHANSGGLVSYGPDPVDQFRRAAGYVDRILKGEKPADLPVQNPTKYELVINLKTAKTLGLEFPPSVLARADEVIE